MASTSPRYELHPTTTVGSDAASPRPHRAGTFLLRLLEGLGSYPSVWDPWLLQTAHRVVKRTDTHR